MKLANDNCFNIESGQISVIDGCPGSGKSLIMIKNIVVETFRQALSHSESPPLRILVCLKRYNKHIKMSLMDGRAESQINFKILITFFKLKKKGTLINQTTPKFQVVVSSCYCKWQPFEKYDIVIVDGATQFSEADMAVLLSYKPSKLILIDDSKQLNLNVPDKDLGRAIYSVSFMDRVLSCHTEKNKSPICHLSIQHRMHPAILHFPNAEFYSNSIRTHPSVLYRHFPLNPYGMFNLHTQDLRATIDNFRFDFLEKLLETINCIMGETMCRIGVITTSTSDMAEIKLRSQIKWVLLFCISNNCS